MTVAFLGIDISKKTFDVSLLTPDGKQKHKKFDNSPEGFATLDAFLKTHMVDNPERVDLHTCLEATGHYGYPLARHLHARGHKTSVVNPAGPNAFARSQLSRTKTDKADAIRIAQFCQANRPHLWNPPSVPREVLGALTRRLFALTQMRQAEQQRIESVTGLSEEVRAGKGGAVLQSLVETVAFLDAQIKSLQKQIDEHVDGDDTLRHEAGLLESIPGVGSKTAQVLLCELGDWRRFEGARAVAAYVGVVPRTWESGTSVKGRGRMCKLGNGRLRRALYFPAISALRHNEVIMAMGERMKKSGKSAMSIIGAAMRRLVHLAYGVLKSGRPFDPSIALQGARERA